MSLATNDTLALTVDNTGFLLDRLGADCHPLQFLRELTQNSIAAILETASKTGDILWDVDWTPHELGERLPYKLCITDNGCGMTGPEMVKYINQLSSSAQVQSVDGNYGVGAKIAAATRNHAGLIYLSWKNGQGSMIHLWRDPKTGQYGLRQIQRPDGTFGHSASVDDAIKPDLIDQHGTRVILYGMTDDADTVTAPAPEVPAPSRWVARYLNTRYFRIPEGITVKAREGWSVPRSNTETNKLRVVTGQESYLREHAAQSGELALTDAIAKWWILKPEALDLNFSHIESSGHVAALFRDELYEMATGRSGHAKLQQFGIIFGQRQVVIYVEPAANPKRRLTSNTARTQLMINGEPLPWTDWAAEFRERIPAEIRALMDDIAAKATGEDHSKSIKERLKALMDLYKVSRYRPCATGILRIDEPVPTAGGRQLFMPSSNNGNGGGGGERTAKRGPVGGVYSAFLKNDGVPGAQVKPDLFPRVKWVSATDGTRNPEDIEDRAARLLSDQNLLLINADFRVFADMIQHWSNRYTMEHGETAGLRDIVKDSVHDWYEQALVETVIGLQALKGSREWSVKQIEAALNEEALTSVVMQRYHPYNSVKRELGTKIAPLKK